MMNAYSLGFKAWKTRKVLAHTMFIDKTMRISVDKTMRISGESKTFQAGYAHKWGTTPHKKRMSAHLTFLLGLHPQQLHQKQGNQTSVHQSWCMVLLHQLYSGTAKRAAHACFWKIRLGCSWPQSGKAL